MFLFSSLFNSKSSFAILYLLISLSIFGCSSSQSTKDANAETINTLGDFENTESQSENSAQSVSDTEILEKEYYRFKGMINENLPIVLDLNQENGSYVGSYYYTKHKMILRFDGKKNENGEIVLQVYDKLGNIVEYITGRINQNTFIGKWQNADRTKTFPISLTETMDRSILFYVNKAKETDYEIITIRQVPKDGDLTRSQKKILELQGLKISTNKEVEELLKKIDKQEKERPIPIDGIEAYLLKSVEVVFNDFSIGVMKTHYREHVARSTTFFDFNSYFSIDGQKGEEITLESVFGKENLKVIQGKLNKKESEVDNNYSEQSLYRGYSTNRFILGKQGITIVFDENPSGKAAGYGAYEEGEMPEDLLLRWSEIENLIKPDSPVRRIFEN